MLGDALWYRIWVIEALKRAISDAGTDPEFFPLLQRDASLRNDSCSFFIFCIILHILESPRSSRGVRTPCTPPLDLPL